MEHKIKQITNINVTIRQKDLRINERFSLINKISLVFLNHVIVEVYIMRMIIIGLGFFKKILDVSVVVVSKPDTKLKDKRHEVVYVDEVRV